MALRSGHGNGAGVPRVEVLPADELPAGVTAPPRPKAARDSSGKFAPGAGTAALAREAGKARHEALKLERMLGLWEVPEGHEYAPYARLAREWRDEHMAQLAATVGGGIASKPSSAAPVGSMGLSGAGGGMPPKPEVTMGVGGGGAKVVVGVVGVRAYDCTAIEGGV